MKNLRFLPALMLLACAATALAANLPAPEISLSLRGVTDDIVEQGEPLRVIVRLSAPRRIPGAILLSPANGPWSDAVMVEIAPAGGGTAVVRAEATGAPASPSAKLDAGHVAGGLWRISAERAGHLAPGNYVVRARLTIRGGAGWNGEVVSSDRPLQIVAASESAERICQRVINRAQDALLRDQLEEAATVLDALLAKSPDDLGVLTVRADVALRAGNPAAALICLNRVSPKPSAGPPPVEREVMLERAWAALRSSPVPAVKPPAWSWPPAAVTAAPTEAKAALLMMSTPVTAVPSGGVAKAPASSGAAPAVPTATPATPVAVTIPASGPVAKAGKTEPGTVVSARELADGKIIADPAGQWAASATAGSQYGPTRYAPAQATGAPDIPLGMAGNNPDAWCPAKKTEGTDWLEVSFAKPVPAAEVRVRQNSGPGAIVKIEAIEPDGTMHAWWQGMDPFVAPAVREIAWFAVRVPKTSYLVAKVKITLNLAAGPEWKQIDAVQLVSAADR